VEEKKKKKMMMMEMKKLNVSDFHGRLLLLHRTRQASNWNIFNRAELRGTEML
jgi:hypothetical protein